jgi:hypothetical protein
LKTETANTTNTSQDTYRRLAEEFPDEQIGKLKKGGALLDYISIAEAVNRMNLVVGVENWKFEIVRVFGDPRDASAILVEVEVTAEINGKQVTRQAIGGHLVPDKGMELGDAYKSAVSDALKKALTFFGIGLHLSRKEDALLFEQRAAAQPDPAAIAAFAELKKQSKELSEDEKALLRTIWSEANGDVKVGAEAGVAALQEAMSDIALIISRRKSTEAPAEDQPEPVDEVAALKEAFPGSQMIGDE